MSALVVGGGPWGRLAAWRLARAGRRVRLLEGPGGAAGAVAAGMLGPGSEADDRDRELAPLLDRAFAGWDRLADELASESGMDPGLRRCGCLHVATRREHIPEIRHHAETLRELGLPGDWHAGSALREMEPGLGPAVAGGVVLAQEAEIEPRHLLRCLGEAGARAGVDAVPASARELVRDATGRTIGVVDDDGDEHRAALVVLAAGHAAVRLDSTVPLRPVKGQIVRLASTDGTVPLARTIRAPDVYVVPRRRDEVVVGASVEERSDRTVTAGVVLDLLEAAVRVCPELGELELRETAAALRPATPDGRPALGPDPRGGLVWAVGGHRHGILLLPVVAATIDAVAQGGGRDPALVGLAPERFATVAT